MKTKIETFTSEVFFLNTYIYIYIYIYKYILTLNRLGFLNDFSSKEVAYLALNL